MLLELCLSFLQIGAFSFGGGYAVLAFIQREIITNQGWISPDDFVNMVAIAQMTPGSMAVNASATVGYNLEGILGGVLCALCTMAIPFVLTLVVAITYKKLKNNATVRNAFAGIRPLAVGIVGAACLSVAKVSIVGVSSLLFVGIGLLLVGKFKVTPIFTLIICGALGAGFYSYLLPLITSAV